MIPLRGPVARQKCLLTEKRHLEQELSSSRQALLLAQQQQQILQAAGVRHQPIQLQPCLAAAATAGAAGAMLSLSEQSCLIDALQSQDEALQEAEERICFESAIAGHLSTVLQEVRAAAGSAAAEENQDDVRSLGHQLLDLLDAFQVPAMAPAATLCPVSSLAIVQQAHKLLLQQVLLLRGRLPSSASPTQHPDKDSSSSHSSRPGSPTRGAMRPDKALDVLNFLRSHVQRIQAMLDTLPGPSAMHHLQQQQLQQPQPGQLQYSPGQDLSCLPSLGPVQASRPASAAAGLTSLAASRPMSGSSTPCRPRPFSAQAASASGRGLLQGTAVAKQALSRAIRHAADGPDLAPYLTFPPKRPCSAKAMRPSALQHAVFDAEAQAAAAAKAAYENAQLVVQLQQVLADREEELQLQAQQQDEMCQQLLAEKEEQLQLQAQQQDEMCQQLLAEKEEQLQLQAQQCGALQKQVLAEKEQQLQLQVQEISKLHQLLAEKQMQGQRQAQQEAQLQQQLQQLTAATEEQYKQQAQQHGALQQQLQQLLAEHQEQSELQAKQRVQLQQQLDEALQQLDAVQQQCIAAAQLATSRQQQLDSTMQQLQQLQAVRAQQEMQLQQLQETTAEMCGEQAAAQDKAVSLEQQLQQHCREKVELQEKLLAAEEDVQKLQGLLHEQAQQHAEVEHAWQERLKQLAHALLTQRGCEGGSSANTEQLEGQLEESTAAVEESMQGLQAVCAASARASSTGVDGLPFSVRRFSQLEVSTSSDKQTAAGADASLCGMLHGEASDD